MISRRVCIAFYSFVLVLVSSSVAGNAATLGVSADESVTGGGSADTNWGSDGEYRGGLWTGCDYVDDEDNPARFYLKFELPSYDAGTYISSATLWGYYSDDYDSSVSQTHSFYLGASDAWTEAAITFNNQPGWTGSAIAQFDASTGGPPRWVSFDITSAFDGAYQGDGVLTLMMKADDETLNSGNWEYFADRTYDDDTKGFYVDYTTAPGLPAFALVGAVPLVGGLVRKLRKR